jgi:hypothetical protein
MAIQAPAHLDGDHPAGDGHLGDLAMTDFAGKVRPAVHHMGEIGVFRYPVQTDPGDRLLLLPVACQFDDFRAIGGNVEVTGFT